MDKGSLDAIRRDYARKILALAGVSSSRLAEAFATVPRENFVPGPPYQLISGGTVWPTVTVPDLYKNVLVVIDRARGINNGEPALHAAWLDAVDPRPGETVIHVGAGTGYYTAMLSLLVGPVGRVEAYETEPDLAADATRHLAAMPNVTVHARSAYGQPLPEADVIYVNAGVTAPDIHWLRAMRPGARLLFPWQPHAGYGPALLVRREGDTYPTRSLMSVGFISCTASMPRNGVCGQPGPSSAEARSIWPMAVRKPDSSAIAIYDDLWLSREGVGAGRQRM